MKRVIAQNKEFVEADMVHDRMYYGTFNKSTNKKGFIVRDNYELGYFRLKSEENMTAGNTYSSFTTSDLKAMIKHIIDNGSFDVYEFSTAKELFKWLSVDN